MPRRYMDVDSLEALWNDTGQLISNLVENAAQDISDVAVQQAQAAADDSIRDAIEAVGDISELAVPLMSDVVRGGAKLGSGLKVDAGALHSKIVFGYEEVGDVNMPTVTIDY